MQKRMQGRLTDMQALQAEMLLHGEMLLPAPAAMHMKPC